MTRRYGTGARVFHWLMVVLFLAQIPAGIAMIAPGLRQETIDTLYVLHKGLGTVLLLIVFARVLWRLAHPAPPMPADWPPLERRIASATHAAIYVVLVVIVVSGYVHVIGAGFPIELLNAIGVPPLIPEMPRTAVVASLVHRFSVFVLTGLVAVHIAEVLRHHFVLRDGALGRMWPPVGDPGVDETTDSTGGRAAVGGAPPR
jgi:cytochrome b561